MEQLIYERIQSNLKRLRLNQTEEILETVIRNAEEEKISYLAFLDRLLEEEVAAKGSYENCWASLCQNY